MFEYKITPKAPLMFRDGKPFGSDDNIADTLSYPMPSTIAGALRTAWGEAHSGGYDYESNKKTILKKRVLGPLLLETKIKDNKEESKILFPAPADALVLNQASENKIYRLQPQAINENEGTNLINQDLLPVFLDKNAPQAKPDKDANRFWSFDDYMKWQQLDETGIVQVSTQEYLPIENRTHVAINKSNGTAEDGNLFQTASLDFAEQKNVKPDENSFGWNNKYYSLLSCFQEDIPNTYRTVGGEARLAYIEKTENTENTWHKCHEDLANALVNSSKGFKLTLVTPAIFKNGYIPSFIKDNLEGKIANLKVKLKAVSVPRWQAGTSWDMADGKSRTGKGMRKLQRLTPAGTVYWFETLQGSNADLVHLWLCSIADANRKEERFNDGYALVIPGVWNMSNINSET